MSTSDAKVTVLTPVYNGERHLREAVESILAQTFADFELLLINDGSTDRSREIMASFDDPRVTVVDNGRNLGLIETLNKGVGLARGRYIARMDCDDISLPGRLAKQVAFLDADPEVAVCGAWVRKIGLPKEKVCRYHGDPRLLACGLLFDPVLAHPAVMFRRDLFRDNGLCYDAGFKHAEDYELWVRAFRKGLKLGNVQEVLLDYRVHEGQVSNCFDSEQHDAAGRVRLALLEELGLEPDREQFETHQRISHYLAGDDGSFFEKADRWTCVLKDANDRTRLFPEPHFSAVLTERLVTLLKKMLERKIVPSGRWAKPRLFAKTGLGWVFAAEMFMKARKGSFKLPYA